MPFLKHIYSLMRSNVFTALCVAGILYATLAERPAGAESLPLFPGVDKMIHALMFATLTGAALFDYRRRQLHHKRPATLTGAVMGFVGVAVIGFGALDEGLQQWLTAGRSAELADWLADCGGCLAAIVAACIWQRRRAAHRPACRD